MKQPEGFVEEGKEHLVCKLRQKDETELVRNLPGVGTLCWTRT